MVAIAKQTDLQDNHPDVAIQFAVAVRNSLDSMVTKQGGRLQFRIGIACTEIAAEKRSSVQQIQAEWAVALDQASRMEARVPINQIQINSGMKRLIRHPMVNTSIGDNYLVAGG
jgi:class 3 adenylate cyclase